MQAFVAETKIYKSISKIAWYSANINLPQMIFWLAQSTLGFEKENVIFNWLQMTSFPSNVLVFHINRHTYIEFKETLLMSDMFRNISWALQDPIKYQNHSSGVNFD